MENQVQSELLDLPHVTKPPRQDDTLQRKPQELAANDNVDEGEWPMLPFPDGWYAAC